MQSYSVLGVTVQLPQVELMNKTLLLNTYYLLLSIFFVVGVSIYFCCIY